MHKLVAHQLKSATRPDGSIDAEMLTRLMRRTYEEFDRERRLTDRAAKLMEEELQEANAEIRRLAEQRLADTLESVPNPVALLSPSCRVASVNSVMSLLCASVLRPPVPGEDFAQFLAGLVPGTEAGKCVLGMQTGHSMELAIGGRWYLGTMKKFTDGGYAVTLSDVTVMKERETVLALAKEAAESANRLKSQFLATMSHELRTPLNAILGFSEMIWSHVLGDTPDAWARYSDYARSIHSSGDHLRLLISEVLDLSKIDAGAFQLHIEACDMSALVANSLVLVRPQAERGGVRLLPFRLECDPVIPADSRAIKQVLINLLSNAVKFTPQGGDVEVICRDAGDSMLVSVRDTGIGIAAEHQKNVFEPFHQGNAHIARRYEGTGLGLAIVRGIIQMHQGEVWLESQQNAGTEVFFRLPRANQNQKNAA
ncbi:MAG TPA: HAMP domain-containing sensor histidine kinase [Rhizomicrobium sp.]|nr:HAMP domain-containing sensor histidine kinase [Rhizomicrobium sp.]